MKIKYLLTLVMIFLAGSASATTPSKSPDDALDDLKQYVDMQATRIGTTNQFSKLTLADIQMHGNTIKVVYNKQDPNFCALLPDITQGRFKTDAQENRYLCRQLGLYEITSAIHDNPILLDAIKDKKFSWDVYVMDPTLNVPVFTYTYNYTAINNSIQLNNGDVTSDFKTFVSRDLVNRALNSIITHVYIPHDSCGISAATFTGNQVKCRLICAPTIFTKLSAHDGMVARNLWIEAFLEDCMSHTYYNDMFDIMRMKNVNVTLNLEDVSGKYATTTYQISIYDILGAVKHNVTDGMDVADYAVAQLGGFKQTRMTRGSFVASHSDDVRKVIKNYKANGSERVYDVVDDMPEFPGGSRALADYLYGHVTYPENAKKYRVEGNVTCKFIVTKDGNIKDVEVTQSLQPILDAEAKRVISMMPQWIPGRHHGERVNTRYTVPVSFHLAND